jgi:hypothetical protein
MLQATAGGPGAAGAPGPHVAGKPLVPIDVGTNNDVDVLY